MTETLNLTKDEKIDLTKGRTGLAVLALGLGWDANPGNAGTFDLDAFAVLLNDQKKVVGPSLNESVCYFSNKKLKGIEHGGDNLTGAGDGDDETIIMTLDQVDPAVQAVLVCVNIYQAAQKGQKFGQVKNSFIRAYDKATNQEIFKYDLQEDYGNFTGVVFGRVYRHNGEWKFEAIGQGVNGDINEIITAYKN